MPASHDDSIDDGVGVGYGDDDSSDDDYGKHVIWRQINSDPQLPGQVQVCQEPNEHHRPAGSLAVSGNQ